MENSVLFWTNYSKIMLNTKKLICFLVCVLLERTWQQIKHKTDATRCIQFASNCTASFSGTNGRVIRKKTGERETLLPANYIQNLEQNLLLVRLALQLKLPWRSSQVSRDTENSNFRIDLPG